MKCAEEFQKLPADDQHKLVESLSVDGLTTSDVENLPFFSEHTEARNKVESTVCFKEEEEVGFTNYPGVWKDRVKIQATALGMMETGGTPGSQLIH